MGEGAYCNFDLILERSGEDYRVRVLDSPAGQASARLNVPLSAMELENFVLRIGRPRTGVRRMDTQQMEAVKKCGDRLFRAVFTDDVYACFLRSRDIALQEEGGLRIRLRIDVPEFHDFPWELLYHARLNQFLALSKDTPVVRYLDLPYPPQPLAVKPPLKILVMISSPQGFPSLNVDEEWRRLRAALAPLTSRGLVELERLGRPTLSALQQQLRRGGYHIFHFIGHGRYSEDKQDGLLLLEDDDRQGHPFSGQYLGTVLHDHHPLRLVVLNACEGARTSQEDPYTGVAQTLVLQGIPAVIAMQFEIAENAAITFAQEFYGAVADGFPVDAALSEARKAIFAAGNDVEWATPVLYMHTPQGMIFDLPKMESGRSLPTQEPAHMDQELEQRLEQLYTEGLAALWVEDWDKACDRFQKLLEDRPGHVMASEKLEEARRQRNVAGLYTRAVDAQIAEDWPKALAALEELLKEAPDYRDAGSRLKVVGRQKQLSGLYAQARRLHTAKKWEAVVKVFDQLKSIDPSYLDQDNLLATAQAEVEELQRQTELRGLYSRAVNEMEAHRWGQARALLLQIQNARPAFLETERLLSRAETEIREAEQEQRRRDQIDTLYEQAHGLLRAGRWRSTLDKIGEIRGLDEQFEDPDKLAEQAQEGLASDEKEAEHQNVLAGMYAEALRLLRAEKYAEVLEKWSDIRAMDPAYPDRQMVEQTAERNLASQKERARKEREARRQDDLAAMYAEALLLLRSEKYREALEKWQEIKAIDARYPDRQLAERTARRELASAAESLPLRQRVALPGKWLWTGAAAILAVTLIFVVLILVDTGGSDMYDDFWRSTFQGAFNPDLWRYEEHSPGGEVRQDNGVLVITQGGVDRWTTLAASQYQAYRIEESGYLEAQLRIDPGVDGFVKIIARTSLPGGIPMCGLYAMPEQLLAQCWTRSSGAPSFPVEYGAWHTARIEVDAASNSIRYFVDGRKLGEDRFETLRGAQLWFSVGVHAGPERPAYAGPVMGFVDKVRIGPLR